MMIAVITGPSARTWIGLVDASDEPECLAQVEERGNITLLHPALVHEVIVPADPRLALSGAMGMNTLTIPIPLGLPHYHFDASTIVAKAAFFRPTSLGDTASPLLGNYAQYLSQQEARFARERNGRV